MKFIEHTYPRIKEDNMVENWANFIKKIEFKKQVIDLHASGELNYKYVRKNLNQMPILSTGGYSDTFLKFISNAFNSQIVKCRDFTQFVITAIDALMRKSLCRVHHKASKESQSCVARRLPSMA